MNEIRLPAKLVLLNTDLVQLRGDSQLFQTYYKELLGFDHEIEIEVILRKTEHKKTNPQLRYLHGVVYPLISNCLSEIMGEAVTVEQVDFILKEKFFYEEVVNEKREILHMPRQLRTTTKKEMQQYINDCVEFAHSVLDCNIPEPVSHYKNQSL